MVEQIREQLLTAGVRNLKAFGYPGVTKVNILTDYVYKKFFKGMLEENKGKSAKHDPVIDQLLKEIGE